MGYADLGQKYRNPILFADYSDPDVIRVGDTFYMTASSFNYTPGLPILVSNDLVNWELVNYAIDNIGQERFGIPRHSEGVWAPAIRYHDGMFYIYYGMPDEGYYVVRTKDPLDKWEKPVCILEGKGLIDSCPFWDEDGKAYVIHGYAKSRIGFKSILGIFEMSPDGLKAISEDHFIFNGNDPEHPAVTIEGPKVYKRNGYYYIWAPAGGVKEGYQVVLRSRDIHGPYEIRTVMDSGNTVINGPHQGGLVDTVNGDEWFVHFQDRGLYGRICHLQPVKWIGDWPVVGVPRHKDAENNISAVPGRDEQNNDADGWNRLKGEPVYEHVKPNCTLKENSNVGGLQASDRFPGGKIGLQWQWMGDHREDFAGQIPCPSDTNSASDGLRLFCLNPSGDENPIIWRSANVLTQKLIYPVFEATVNMDISGLGDGDRAGVVMTGGQYLTAYIEKKDSEYYVCVAQSEGNDADKKEIVKNRTALKEFAGSTNVANNSKLAFRMTFTYKGREFDSSKLYFQNVNAPMFGENPSLSIEIGFMSDKIHYHDLGVNYTPSDHTWVGAKLGIYALSGSAKETSTGYADFDDFIVKEL